jgi:hypothetical protein
MTSHTLVFRPVRGAVTRRAALERRPTERASTVAAMFPGSPRARALLLLACVSVALGGCGSSSSGNGVATKTPAEILAATQAVADAATSVHVSGSIAAGATPITFDLELLAGRGGRGQLAENGLGFELIQLAGTVFIKGSSAFYRHIGGTAAAQLLEGKWLKAPTSDAEFASLGSLTDLHSLIEKALANHGSLAKGQVTTVNGQKAVGVSDTSKGGTLYVATTGPPYPIEVSETGASGGMISFSRWNQPVTVRAPANAIDITRLQSSH